jgi:Fe-S-cluster-containing dehydrogenase component
MTEKEHIDRLLSRRDALKIMGTGLAVFLLQPDAAAASEGTDSSNHAAMLYDATRCIGCRACEAACSACHTQPPHEHGEAPCDLAPYDWTVIKQYRDGNEMSFRKFQCMHCEHPACVSVCPVQAMQKLENGPVVYDPDKCIGCRYCVVACPFHVPRIDWNKSFPEITKCNFCADRLQEGLIPACAAACPKGALTFGTREQILQEAHARIDQNPDLYNGRVYGEKEVGGTGWMYLASVPFESLGFPEMDCCPVAKTSEAVATYGTPGALVAVGATLGGISWMSRRWRIDAEEDAETKAEEEA